MQRGCWSRENPCRSLDGEQTITANKPNHPAEFVGQLFARAGLKSNIRVFSGPVATGGPDVENKERWMELCAQASQEQDPERLFKLVQEIDNLTGRKGSSIEEGPLDPARQH